MSWRTPAVRSCTLLMEAMWTYAVVAFVIAGVSEGDQVPSFLAVCAIVFASYGISRGLQNSELSLGVLRLWGVVFSFLVFYAIVRIDLFDWRLWDFNWANDLFNRTEDSARANVGAVFGIPLLWAFWVRGILRGQETSTFEDVVTSFGIGFLVIAFVEVFQGKVEGMPSLVGKIAIPYVAFSLFAVGLANSAQAEGERTKPVIRTLVPAIAVSVLALGLAAAAVALFDAATGWGAARDASRSLLDAGEAAGSVLLWPFLKFMDGVFWVLIWLRDHILGTPEPPRPDQAAIDETPTCVQVLIDQGKTMEQAVKQCTPQPKDLPEWVKLLVRIIIATPIVGLVVLLTAGYFSRFRKQRRTGGVKESAYQQGRLASDLSDLWHNLVGRLRPSFHIGSGLDPVRKLYFEMLQDGERRGILRRPGQTPDELAPVLERNFHDAAPAQITSAFDDARYGSRQVPDETVRRLREQWERLRE